MPPINRWVFLWRTRPYLWWLEICKQTKLIVNALLLGGPDYHAAITEAYELLKEAHCVGVIADMWEEAEETPDE